MLQSPCGAQELGGPGHRQRQQFATRLRVGPVTCRGPPSPRVTALPTWRERCPDPAYEARNPGRPADGWRRCDRAPLPGDRRFRRRTQLVCGRCRRRRVTDASMLRGGLYRTIRSCLARRTWGVSHLDVSREHAAGAEPAVANAGRDWKRVCRDLSNIEDVRITLCEPNSELRMSLRMALAISTTAILCAAWKPRLS